MEEQAEGDNPNKGLLKRIDKLTAKDGKLKAKWIHWNRRSPNYALN